ncbi:uncharacterized protein LOC135709609 [Ochlerotatus camptorhynchus]|uniref:uncharacterized protein LOC135709609 n=1 Tax=Ochlerotatus camptorhynchus TaxID=644619 RepID=UPI0031D12FC5
MGQDAPKRPRKQAGASNHTERLLQSNPFSALPEEADVDLVEKREKVPPLFTSTKELALPRNELAKNQIHPLFKLCSTGITILCSTLVDYNAVGTILQLNRFEFYTHDVPGRKPLKMVIRVPIARRDETSAFRDQLYLVPFDKDSTSVAVLRQIRALFNIVIQWEQYRPRHRDVTQCTNCLAFGHGTNNCHMKARCCKCAGAHNTTACKKEEEAEPKCVNCHSNHLDSDRRCPKRVAFIQIRQQASTRNQPGRHRNNRAPLVNKDTFPVLPARRMVPNLAPLPLNQRPSPPTRCKSNNRSSGPQPPFCSASPH